MLDYLVEFGYGNYSVSVFFGGILGLYGFIIGILF